MWPGTDVDEDGLAWSSHKRNVAWRRHKITRETDGGFDFGLARIASKKAGGNRQMTIAQHRDREFPMADGFDRSEEHTSELQSLRQLVCRLLLEKKNRVRNIVRAVREIPGDDREIVLRVVGAAVLPLAPLKQGLRAPAVLRRAVAHHGDPSEGGEAAEVLRRRAAVVVEAHQVPELVRGRVPLVVAAALVVDVAAPRCPEGFFL